MQDQKIVERWDGIVADWLAECNELETEVCSVRKIVRPFAMVVSSNSATRQTHQIRLTQAGYQTVTARDLLAALQKSCGRKLAMIVLDESSISEVESELIMELSKRSESFRMLGVDPVIA